MFNLPLGPLRLRGLAQERRLLIRRSPVLLKVQRALELGQGASIAQAFLLERLTGNVLAAEAEVAEPFVRVEARELLALGTPEGAMGRVFTRNDHIDNVDLHLARLGVLDLQVHWLHPVGRVTKRIHCTR